MGIYIVAKFGTDWSIFADARMLTKSNMANFLIQGQITCVISQSVPENQRKSRKIKSIVPHLSEKIMACMSRDPLNKATCKI